MACHPDAGRNEVEQELERLWDALEAIAAATDGRASGDPDPGLEPRGED